jgi:hypothetical protein
MRILVSGAVCVLAVTAGAASAQDQGTQDGRGVQGGVKVGMTSTTLSVTGLEGFDPQADIGVLAGGWVSAGRGIARMQAELFFSTRRFSSPSPAGDIEVSSRAFDVPILLMTRWRPDGRVHPLLFGGPYVAFISRTTQTVGSTKTDLDEQIKGVDAGALVGLGVEAGTGRGAVVLEVRYALGMRDLSEAAETTFKSRAFMASFGYRF